VVVRARLDPRLGADYGGPSMTDAVGVLVSVDERHLVVETRRGPVTIERARVVAAKEVPPRPGRRGAAHLALSVADLQRVMAPAWGAVEQERLGDWLLRASSGFTQRGNSVVPVGDPGRPLEDAVEEVVRWYAARGLPAKVVLAGPVGFDVADDPLGALLLRRGWTRSSLTHALTAAATTVVATDPGGPAVATRPEPDAAWLEAYARSRRTVQGVTEQVLTGSPRQVFAHVLPGGGLSQQLGLRPEGAAGSVPVAIGRLGIAHGWAGLGAVWTDPAHRGRGLAAHLTARLAAHALEQGVSLLHLQVEHDNELALRLYRRLGFDHHSSYVYLCAPETG
jgi:ribosomal protein S18 acetylase RimI-like enzyme